jgi:PAS domain S-box-containing protein
MLHAADEASYMREVCGIVTQSCGYAMVWIGLAEHDEAKTVRPAAHAGAEKGYLANFKISWADDERGRGPTGTAIRTGKPAGCRDMRSDPAFAPWRDEALRRGYASSLVLPLQRRGQTFGALTIYSNTPDAFSEQETWLLAELADDLAAGINILRLRLEKEQAAEALRQREEQLGLFVENAPAAIAMLDREMRYIRVSRRWMADYNLGKRDITGLSHYEVFPDAPERWKEIHRRCLAGATERCDEDAFARADGSTNWLRWEIRAWYASPGEVGGLIIFSEDITERKQTLEALRASQDLLQAVTDGSPNPIFMKDRQSRLMLANPATLRAMGRSAEEVLGKDDSQVYDDPAIGRAIVEADRRIMEAGVTQTVEETIATPEGTRFFLSTKTPRRDADNKVIGLIGVATDITERKQAEERYRVLFSTMLEGFCIIEVVFDAHDKPVDYRFLEINPAFEKQTGMHDAQGKLMRDLAPEHEAHWFELYGRVALTGEPARFVNEARALNRWYDVAAWKIGGKESRKVAILFNDISDAKRAETALRQAHADLERKVLERTIELQSANVKLQEEIARRTRAQVEKEKLAAQFLQSQKLEAVGLLAGGIAHDFNNIVSAIVGNNFFLLEDIAPSDPLRHHCLEIKRSTDMAASLTRQLLALTRKQVVQVRVMDPNTVIMGMSAMLRTLLGKSTQLSLRLHSGLWPVKMDTGQLEQIVMNLAINARDAMPQGGRLTVLTKNHEVKKARRPACESDLPPGLYALLTFRDDGMGMDEATQARIFEPFFTTKEPGRGTGLGLAMVQTIVKEYQGHIRVASAPRQGTTFQIYLPCAQGGAEAMLPGSMAPEMAGGHETILVVDDNDGFRSIIGKTLQSKGYHVISAGSAEEAEAQCGENLQAVDLLLTDLTLPGMNGANLAAGLKKKRPQLRVVFMSGYPGTTLASGAWHEKSVLLEKPFSPEILLRTLRQALKGP